MCCFNKTLDGIRRQCWDTIDIIRGVIDEIERVCAAIQTTNVNTTTTTTTTTTIGTTDQLLQYLNSLCITLASLLRNQHAQAKLGQQALGTIVECCVQTASCVGCCILAAVLASPVCYLSFM